jgi:MoxR-like ATPase
VLPDDIKYLAPVALPHRLIVRPEAELRGRTAKVILEDILRQTALDLGKVEK